MTTTWNKDIATSNGTKTNRNAWQPSTSEPDTTTTELATSLEGEAVFVEKTPQTLQTLLPELQLAIFDKLGRTSSICLGLTCKQFRTIHMRTNGQVPLNNYELYLRDPPPPGNNRSVNPEYRQLADHPSENPFSLCFLLEEWMAKGGYALFPDLDSRIVFVKRNTLSQEDIRDVGKAMTIASLQRQLYLI